MTIPSFSNAAVLSSQNETATPHLAVAEVPTYADAMTIPKENARGQFHFLILFVSLLGGALGGGATALVLRPENRPEVRPSATSDSIAARSIKLVDSRGKARALLAFSAEGTPGFWLFDDRGVARLAMGLYADGTSHFGLQDKNGQMIELMRSFGPSEAPLLIFKSAGQDRMITGLSIEKQEPFLINFDRERKPTHQFGHYDGP